MAGFEYRFKRMAAEQGRRFFVSGGTLPADSASYLERNADKVLWESLLAGRFCYVLNSRQLGKSSLSVHTIRRLEAVGVRTAFLDLTRIGGKNVSPEQWYTGLAMELARELGRRTEAVIYWRTNASLAPVHRLFGMLRDVILGEDGQAAPLVIFIDEIDATKGLIFDPDEFFAAIRECFNRRVSDSTFERLTFCLLGVAVPSDLIRSRATTPFNIGERITLEDFTPEELAAFAPELGPNGRAVVARVHYWTGGHPFLSQSLCRSLVSLGGIENAKAVDEVVRSELFHRKARESNINLADVANIALHYGDDRVEPEAFRATLLSTYQRIWAGREVIDDESNREIVQLKLSGIIVSDGQRLVVRNRIYQHVFNRVWIEQHMPEQEIRRQRQSYRRGAWRTALVAGAILILMGLMAAFSWRARRTALDAVATLDYELYIADMNSLRPFYENGDSARIDAVLKRHRNSPYRGFEWGYWLGKFHDSKEEYSLDYRASGKREEGAVSTDGKEVCIVDVPSSTATIVNRATKERLWSGPIAVTETVIPLKNRWGLVVRGNRTNTICDLKSRAVLCNFDVPKLGAPWVTPKDHSDFVVSGETDRNDLVGEYIAVWDVANGWRLDIFPNPGEGGHSVTISSSGRFLACLQRSIDPNTSKRPPEAALQLVVRDVLTHKYIDRFPIDGGLADPIKTGISPDGRWIFFGDATKSYIRDVAAHRTREWRPTLEHPYDVLSATVDEKTVVLHIDGARSVVADAPDKNRVSVRENVITLKPGSRSGQYLASSDSVRFYDIGSASSADAVAGGVRVTRYGPNELNLTMRGPTAMTRISATGFQETRPDPPVPDSFNCTSNGHWFLLKGRDGRLDELGDSDRRYPRIPLPFVPTNWSCGLDPDSIVCFSVFSRRLAGFSGRTGRVRWSRSDIKGIDGFWVSADGRRLFLSTAGLDFLVLNMATGTTIGSMAAHNNGPINFTTSADQRRLFTCGGDGMVVMWDMATFRKQMEFRGNEQISMTSADISPDGRRVVTTNAAGSWQLWDAATGIQLMDVRASTQSLSSALFSADGQSIVTAGDDQKVRVWRSVERDPTTYIAVNPSDLAHLHR